MLTNDDIDILMDALDELASKNVSDGLMSSMLAMMLSKDKDESISETERIMDESKRKDEALKDTIIILEAKLLQMRDKITMDGAISMLQNGENI